MDQVPPAPFTNLRRNQPLAEAGGYAPIDWYAMYPTMYVGDARAATPEKGKIMAEKRVADLVTLIRRVKEDTVTPELQEDFLKRKRNPSSPDSWTQ
jgi:creatinine amidohydrolase/Fe(II)-dependent formamide hydrolase-like protein